MCLNGPCNCSNSSYAPLTGSSTFSASRTPATPATFNFSGRTGPPLSSVSYPIVQTPSPSPNILQWQSQYPSQYPNSPIGMVTHAHISQNPATQPYFPPAPSYNQTQLQFHNQFYHSFAPQGSTSSNPQLQAVLNDATGAILNTGSASRPMSKRKKSANDTSGSSTKQRKATTGTPATQAQTEHLVHGVGPIIPSSTDVKQGSESESEFLRPRGSLVTAL